MPEAIPETVNKIMAAYEAGTAQDRRDFFRELLMKYNRDALVHAIDHINIKTPCNKEASDD
jgi:hypothetical protein